MNPDRVGAVVVTFEPDADWPGRLAAIIAEQVTVMVVDNSLSAPARRQVREVAEARGARYLGNPDNPGIGRALNQGFAALAADGIDWVIAFDQDSRPAVGLKSALLAAAEGGTAGPVAAVGSNWNEANGEATRFLTAHPSWPGFYRRQAATADLDGVICLINSGTLFSVRMWRELGGFDEGLFLDLVDSDFCLRARRAGGRLRIAARAGLTHARGRKREVKFLGGRFRPAFMPPFRLYCLYRNRMLLLRKHRLQPAAWVAYECVYAGKVLADILFLEDQKLAKLGACLRGTLAGLGGRNGPPPRFA